MSVVSQASSVVGAAAALGSDHQVLFTVPELGDDPVSTLSRLQGVRLAGVLVASGQIDYLVFDYLAEVTMSILAAQRAKDPKAGYAVDFVQIMMREALSA